LLEEGSLRDVIKDYRNGDKKDSEVIWHRAYPMRLFATK